DALQGATEARPLQPASGHEQGRGHARHRPEDGVPEEKQSERERVRNEEPGGEAVPPLPGAEEPRGEDAEREAERYRVLLALVDDVPRQVGVAAVGVSQVEDGDLRAL